MEELIFLMIVCNSDKGFRQRRVLEILSTVSLMSQIRFNLWILSTVSLMSQLRFNLWILSGGGSLCIPSATYGEHHQLPGVTVPSGILLPNLPATPPQHPTSDHPATVWPLLSCEHGWHGAPDQGDLIPVFYQSETLRWGGLRAVPGKNNLTGLFTKIKVIFKLFLDKQ